MNHAVFGGGATDTVLHPLVLVVMLIAIGVIIGASRRAALAAMLLTVFLAPLGQVVLLGGVHFTVLRIIILAGLVRLFRDRSKLAKSSRAHLERIDRLFIYWAICRAVVFMLLWLQRDAVINQCGLLVDSLGGYFVLRWFIQDEEDLIFGVKVFAVLATVMAVFMLYEQTTQVNAFGLLGGVKLNPEVREGRIRCQGVFQHSILAGVFGGTLLALFCGFGDSEEPRS